MKKLAWLIPTLLPLSQPAWPAADLISRQMVDEARMWQQKDRDDLAARVWRRLLAADPRHPEALIRLGIIEARSGDIKQAESLHARARRLSPAPAGLQELTSALEAVKKTGKKEAPAAPTRTDVAAKGDAAEVKRTASAPKAEQPLPSVNVAAAKTSGQLSGKREKEAVKEPANPGAILNQFRTASAINEHWADTRRKLEEHVRRHPHNPAYRFALARHLTYRDSTRREGLRQLSALPSNIQSDAETKSVWREGLLALEPRQGDVALFTFYLKRFPDDSAVRTRAQALPQSATSAAPSIASATGAFSSATSAPRIDSSDTTKARGIGQAGGQTDTLLRSALADEQAGAYGSAARRLERAMLLDPANPSIRIALARQYERMGALDNAANLLDAVLVSYPDSLDAIEARAELFIAQQDWLNGLNMLERVPARLRTPELVRSQHRLWTGAQTSRARRWHQQGNTLQATAILDQTEAEARGDDIMLALIASGWGEIGQVIRGLRIMRDALSRSPSQHVSFRIKYAELLLRAAQDAELSAVLRDLAVPGRLNAAQQETVNGIILAYTLRLAESLRESGRLAEASSMLSPVLQRTEDVRALAAMARIHRSASDPVRALPFIEKAIAREPQDAGHRLLASELAIAAKDLDKAELHAKAALELAPNHPRVLSALGRVERFKGNKAKALEHFQRAYTLEYDRNAFNGDHLSPQLRLVSHEQGPSTTIPAPPPDGGLLPIPQAFIRSVPGAPDYSYPEASAQTTVVPMMQPPVLSPSTLGAQVVHIPAHTRSQAPESVSASPANQAEPLRLALASASRRSQEAYVQRTALAYSATVIRDPRLDDPAFQAVYGRAFDAVELQEGKTEDGGVKLKMSMSIKWRDKAKTYGKAS